MKKAREGAAVRAEAWDIRTFERSGCCRCSSMMSSMNGDDMRLLDARTVRRKGARRRLPAGLNLIVADATPTMSACVVMPEVWC